MRGKAVDNHFHLDETNINGSLPEALTAHIDLVLSDNGGRVVAHSARPGSLRAEDFLGVRIN